MSNKKNIEGTLYLVRVKGNLDPRWGNWFEGFVIASHSNGETLLSGRVADQAALYGLLGKINRLGLSLLFVAQGDYLCDRSRCPLWQPRPLTSSDAST